MQTPFWKSWATYSIVITFVIGGLGAVANLVPASDAAWITTIVSVLGFVLHQKQSTATS